MKKSLTILICLPIIWFGGQSYVTNDNFEQKLFDSKYDITLLSNYGNTSIFSLVTHSNIFNVKSIENFTALNIFLLQPEGDELDLIIIGFLKILHTIKQ